MPDRLSLDNLIKEDENLILNKMKIHNEMKEKIIEHQYNKLNKCNAENIVLQKELEIIKIEYNSIKKSLQSYINNSKGPIANTTNKKSLKDKNSSNLNNANNNLNGTKSKILQKAKTPMKSIKTVNRVNKINNNCDNNNNSKELNHSNANNSLLSKNSTNNKSIEIMNATFRASKSSFNNINDSNNKDLNKHSNGNNKNLLLNKEILKKDFNKNNLLNKNNKINNNISIDLNPDNENKRELLGSLKKGGLKSNSNIITQKHRKNNSLCEKSLELNVLKNSPSLKINKLNLIEERIFSPQKNIKKQQLISPTSQPMNITMKVNNINNFNSNIHANIISNSAGSVNKQLFEAQSNLINYSNLNTNSNFLNDSFNNNNENLLKKMINLDFLGEKCNIISNSPINSPKIKFSTLQTENSNDNFKGESPQKIINSQNFEGFNNANLLNRQNNHQSILLNNELFENRGNDPKENNDRFNETIYIEEINNIKYHFNCDKNINKKSRENDNENYIPNDYIKASNYDNDISSINNINRNNNQQYINKKPNKLINKFQSNDFKEEDMNVIENSNETNSYIENKNSPCFMREFAPVNDNNAINNTNYINNTVNKYTVNEDYSINYENAFVNTKRKLNYDDYVYDKNESDKINKKEIENIEDEKPKDLEYTKTERYSSSIPRKTNFQGKNMTTDIFLDYSVKVIDDEYTSNNKTNRINVKSQNKKNNFIKKNESKKNFDCESTSTPKNLTNKISKLNISNVNKINKNTISNKLVSSNKKSNAQTISLNNYNSNNNYESKEKSIIDSKENEKKFLENSPKGLKKGNSNRIDFNQDILLNSSSSNHYQSNFANYNSSIKKQRQNQDSEFYNETGNLKTHAPWVKPKLNLSDLTDHKVLNKTELCYNAPEADKNPMHTSRNLNKPKKLILVEKMSVKSSKPENYAKNNNNISYLEKTINYDSFSRNNQYEDNFENGQESNYSNYDDNVNKKINVLKVNNKNTRNTLLFNHCKLSSSNTEEQNKTPTDYLEGFSTNLNCAVKGHEKYTKRNNNSVFLCNPNFKESKLAMDLLTKSNTPSKNFDKGIIDFSRNNIKNNNNNSTNKHNLRLNATLQSIKELKKKMNL